MDFADDTRGVSAVIGALFIFAFLVAGIAINQATIVPQQNREVEFNHYDEVRTDLTELGSEVITVAGRNTTGAPSVDLGVRYPARSIALNPPPAAGSLEKRAEGDLDVTAGGGFSTADLCGGGTDTFGIGYRPAYNELTAQPVIYENGQVYVDGESGESVLASRTVIDTVEDRINLYRLSGPIPTGSSVSSRTVILQGSTIIGTARNVDVDSVRFGSSELSASAWNAEAIAGTAATAVEDGDDIRVDFSGTDTYTIRCYTVGVGGASPPSSFGAFETNTAAVKSEGSGANSSVGRGGESAYPTVESATISTSGGVWTGVTGVNAIELTNPRFSPTKASDAQSQVGKRYIRTVMGVTNGSYTYYVIMGPKSGLAYQTGAAGSWNKKEVTIIKERPDGTTTEASTNIDGTVISPADWQGGAALNALSIDQVEAGVSSTYADRVREVRAMLDTDTNEIFIADHHGRVDATLTTVSYSGGATSVLQIDDGTVNAPPAAVDVDDGTGYDGTYAAARIGLVNTRTSDTVDEVTSIEVTTSASSVRQVDASEYSSNSDNSYGIPAYFAGNNQNGRITGAFDTGTTTTFDQTGDIDADSGILLKLNEFQNNGGNPVDLRGESVTLTVTFVINGNTRTETLTATLDDDLQA